LSSLHIFAHRFPSLSLTQSLCSSPSTLLQRIAEEFGGGLDGDQLMHIWRRHAQRGPVARKGKWSQAEDQALLQVNEEGVG
jgi:hypothetical protein